MADQRDDRVGYGRPPKHRRWKKGQSGNPAKKMERPKPSEGMTAMIDRLLGERVQITKNGRPVTMTTLEAVVHQLLQKSLAGNKRANRALHEYLDFARGQQSGGQIEIVFIDNDYTRALSASRPDPDNV